MEAIPKLAVVVQRAEADCAIDSRIFSARAPWRTRVRCGPRQGTAKEGGAVFRFFRLGNPADALIEGEEAEVPLARATARHDEGRRSMTGATSNDGGGGLHGNAEEAMQKSRDPISPPHPRASPSRSG